MFLTYKPSSPDKGEAEEYHFDPATFPNIDAEACERETGLTWFEFVVNLQKGSTQCVRVLLWCFRRRLHRNLDVRSVKFERGEVDIDYDADELAERLEGMRETTPASAADAMAREVAIARTEAAILTAKPAPGKALANDNDGHTSSDS